MFLRLLTLESKSEREAGIASLYTLQIVIKNWLVKPNQYK